MGVQFFIDLVFVMFLFRLVKQLKQNSETHGRFNCCTDENGADKKSSLKTGGSDQERKKTVLAAREIMDLMEPLVRDAETAADSFSQMINEKKYIIKNLNEALDSRIISTNLLLSRTETLLESRRQAPATDNPYMAFNSRASRNDTHQDVFDQQNAILDLHSKGCRAESIASKLSIPEGEVQLVISLKEKFIKMESEV